MKSKTLILLFITLIISCDTEDIMPALSISSDNTELSESDGVTTITASLNTVASQEITLPLTFSGTASFNEDYNSSSSVILIDAGSSSGSIIISSVQDDSIEEIETIIISIESQSQVILLILILPYRFLTMIQILMVME